MKTLIVDDDNIMRRILKRTAMGLGHDVTGCADAENALEALQKERYELIILDWMLPGMDGVELCRQIRQMPKGEKPFIIMVTAKDKHQDLLEVLDAGADDYIAKPVDVKLLKTRFTVAERMVRKLRD
jgi:DNA-binding response OmpR family regulator